MGPLGTITDLTSALDRLAATRSVEKYARIQQMVHEVDVSSSTDFQRLFNGYYRVRQKPAAWYREYYALLEEAKRREPLNFRDLLEVMQRRTSRLEASFCSKMLATLQPEQPVIDSVVLKHFDLRLPYASARDRVAKMVAVHVNLRAHLDAIAQSAAGLAAITAFDARFAAHRSFTPLKKIDLVLWQTRARELAE